jgi:hypothetical protein
MTLVPQRARETGNGIRDRPDDDPLGVLVAGTNTPRQPFVELLDFAVLGLGLGGNGRELNER